MGTRSMTMKTLSRTLQRERTETEAKWVCVHMGASSGTRIALLQINYTSTVCVQDILVNAISQDTLRDSPLHRCPLWLKDEHFRFWSYRSSWLQCQIVTLLNMKPSQIKATDYKHWSDLWPLEVRGQGHSNLKSCEHNISRTLWDIAVKVCTNLHLDLRLDWLDFGGQS